MPTALREVMTRRPVTCRVDDSCAEAARKMAQADIGDVLVQDGDGRITGIVTDRDIVVRAIAKGRDPEKTLVGDICTRELCSLSPADDIDAALRLMKQKAVRRVPVVEDGRPVGIVALGDLAKDRDPNSVLGAVSAAPPNN